MDPSSHSDGDMASLKRKRSPDADSPPSAAYPPHKVSRSTTQSLAASQSQLQINYLARQSDQFLPLITNNDTLPNVLSLLNGYHGVLDRHESMAGNLGGRPLGPMLVKRFERLFDGPPRVLKASSSKDGAGPTITWLDVVEFARNKPEQFQLAQMSEGVQVCQFWTKQCRVQISEEDFQLVSSGMPQKLIPPQPIMEDEEKELGTLEILEKNVASISQLADQVAAKARQFNHRIKGRKQAIIDRRAAETAVSGAAAMRASSPSNVALMNGAPARPSASPTSGFVAVNMLQSPDHNGMSDIPPSNGPINPAAASQATRNDLLSKFFTTDQRPQGNDGSSREAKRQTSAPQTPTHKSHKHARQSDSISSMQYDLYTPPRPPTSSQASPHSTIPIPSTPTGLLPPLRHNVHAEKDDGGPFKAEMVARLEALQKGDRVEPPCDRCRRLRMDCQKNLTACMGCTKKHAKCSWREVKEEEIFNTTHTYQPAGTAAAAAAAAAATSTDVEMADSSICGPGHNEDRERYAPTTQQQQQQQQQQQSPLSRVDLEHQQAAHSLAVAAMDTTPKRGAGAAAGAAATGTASGGSGGGAARDPSTPSSSSAGHPRGRSSGEEEQSDRRGAHDAEKAIVENAAELREGGRQRW